MGDFTDYFTDFGRSRVKVGDVAVVCLPDGAEKYTLVTHVTLRLVRFSDFNLWFYKRNGHAVRRPLSWRVSKAHQEAKFEVEVMSKDEMKAYDQEQVQKEVERTMALQEAHRVGKELEAQLERDIAEVEQSDVTLEELSLALDMALAEPTGNFVANVLARMIAERTR